MRESDDSSCTRKNVSRVLLPLVCVWVGAGEAVATTIHVPGEQPSIQAGLNAASPGDTVLVACGTYYEHSIAMATPSVCLRSETGLSDCVTIDAQQQGHVLYCSSAASFASIVGFTITGGTTTDGGGIWCSSFSFEIASCSFVRNDASGYGGGVYCPGTSPRIVDCAFDVNQGIAGGGGVCCSESSSPTLANCTFSDNISYHGAAVYCRSSSSPTLETCTFEGNEALLGGGVYCDLDSSPTLMACTFVGNDAHEYGSGVYCGSSSSPALTACIVGFGERGGAIHCDDASSNPQLACCDIYGNVGGDWVGSIAPQFGVDGNLSEDPLFCDALNGDFAIDAASPCAQANNPSCGLIGAWDVGCESPVENASWGAIKALYR
jgi:hypothetical protein